MNQLLQEYCDSRGVQTRVDRAAAVIRGVKVLGLHSRNGREYLPEALERAIALYEGAKVNVNHPKGSPIAPRDYQDRIGVIRGVQLRQGEGLFGDLHYNPKHALAEQLVWDAEHSPENVGFSHNVQARASRRDTQLVVEEITRVESVDLVADPATTRGLYEQAAAGGELAELTLERLKADRPDIVTALLTEAAGPSQVQEAEIGRLRTQIESLETTQAAQRLDLLIREEIAAAGLPSNCVTSIFREQLRSAVGADARRALIAERLQIVRGADSIKPRSKDQHLIEGSPGRRLPSDAKSFADSITAF